MDNILVYIKKNWRLLGAWQSSVKGQAIQFSVHLDCRFYTSFSVTETANRLLYAFGLGLLGEPTNRDVPVPSRIARQLFFGICSLHATDLRKNYSVRFQ